MNNKKSILNKDIKDLFKDKSLNKGINLKGIFVLIIVLVGTGIYGYFMVYPKFNEYTETVFKLENSQAKLLEYERKLEKMPVLKDRLYDLIKEVKIKSRKLSYDMEDGLFLISLDNMIRSLEIRLMDYSIEDSVDYTDFYAIPMTLNVEGDYRKIRELIYFLEEQKNITQVMDYSMSAKTTEIRTETSKRVYWTRGEQIYHLDKTCSSMIPGEILYGTPAQSGGREADPGCVGDITNTIDIHTTSTTNGEIAASIRFIVYSSDKNIMKLDIDKPENWKPGKYNPFQDTLN
ncbi:MAG: hypothetical protein RSD22_01670 [Romboutsia sp.]